jgi:hypothetical protein
MPAPYNVRLKTYMWTLIALEHALWMPAIGRSPGVSQVTVSRRSRRSSSQHLPAVLAQPHTLPATTGRGIACGKTARRANDPQNAPWPVSLHAPASTNPASAPTAPTVLGRSVKQSPLQRRDFGVTTFAHRTAVVSFTFRALSWALESAVSPRATTVGVSNSGSSWAE